MKTKSLYPIIVTPDIQETVDFYGNILDYKVKHRFTNPHGVQIVVIANEAGNQVELIEASGNPAVDGHQELYGLRMNIDDMDAAVAELKEKGCRIVAGPFETEMSQNILIEDNNGVQITLMKHIRK